MSAKALAKQASRSRTQQFSFWRRSASSRLSTRQRQTRLCFRADEADFKSALRQNENCCRGRFGRTVCSDDPSIFPFTEPKEAGIISSFKERKGDPNEVMFGVWPDGWIVRTRSRARFHADSVEDREVVVGG
jgi:hypothetical protein